MGCGASSVKPHDCDTTSVTPHDKPSDLSWEAKFDAERRRANELEKQLMQLNAQLNDSVTLDLFHFTDAYSLEEIHLPGKHGDDRVGGALRFKTLVDGVARERDIAPVLLFSGDFVAPSLTSTITHGRHMIEAFNMLGVAAGCWGTHELDFGLEAKTGQHGWQQGLKAILQEREEEPDSSGRPTCFFPASRTKWLCCNMLEADGTPLAGAKRHTILHHYCGGGCPVRIGLFGVLYDCRGAKNKYNLRYLDAVEESKKCVAELKESGAQVIVALTHLPFEKAGELTDQMLMSQCPGIDVLLGGHDHFYLYDPVQRIVKSGTDFRHLSHVKVHLRDGQVQKVECDRYDVTRKVPRNAEMEALVHKYKQLNERSYGKKLGTTQVALDSREQTVRTGPAKLMKFLCDAAVAALPELVDVQGRIDGALIDAKRCSGEFVCPPGDITMKEVQQWFASKGLISLGVVRMTGGVIKLLLELKLKKMPAASLFHVSDDFEYSIRMANPRGSRITDLLYKGNPLDLAATFTCVLPAPLIDDLEAECQAKNLPTPEVLVSEELAVPIVQVVKHELAKRPIDEASVKRECIHLETGDKAAWLKCTDMPNRSSDKDCAEKLDDVEELLHLDSSSWSDSITVGITNMMRYIRAVEVFATHRVKVFSAVKLPCELRPVLDPDCPVYSGLSTFERDCVNKMINYSPGVLVSVMGVCLGSTPLDHMCDELFFVDVTPGQAEVYMRAHSKIGRSRNHFRPSKSIQEFLGQRAAFSVLYGRWERDASTPGEAKVVFFDGGIQHGSIAAVGGANSPAPCLPLEYVFQPEGSDCTIAQTRSQQWAELTSLDAERMISCGLAAGGADHVANGKPTSQCTIRLIGVVP